MTDATNQPGQGTDRHRYRRAGLLSPEEMVRNRQQETLVQQCNDKKLGEFAVRHRRWL